MNEDQKRALSRLLAEMIIDGVMGGNEDDVSLVFENFGNDGKARAVVTFSRKSVEPEKEEGK